MMSNNIFDTDSALGSLLEKLERKYKFKGRLGIGNFARVFLVQHKLFKKEFALKILDFNNIFSMLERGGCEDIETEYSKIKERFINEANIIKNIKHDNIVGIDDLDVIPEESKNIDVPFLTMNYIKGTTLKEKIEKEKGLSPEFAFNISYDILAALKAIHDSNIIHRDIKPANIIIEEKDEKTRAILVDFGIAKDFGKNSKLTQPGVLLGTPMYAAPEQINFESELSPATDIYSFGVVLFEMLTGTPPYDEPDVRSKHINAPVPDVLEIKPELPAGIDQIIKKTMAKNPKERYQNADKFIEDIKNAARKAEYADRDLEEVKKEIDKEYKIEKKLNRGGFAQIYLVRHRQLNELRVLKVMRYSYLLDQRGEKQVEEFKQRFDREGKLLASNKYEHIVKIHDSDKAGKSQIPYLIMEYIKGKSLDELLKEIKPLDFKKAINIAKDILSALNIMHTVQQEPIIHRDIKPSNIMIEENTGKAILIDLGIAKDRMDTANLTIIGSSIGTPAYMSPEQCRGIIDLYPAADIYSLGVVLFEMIAGDVPFKSDINDPIRVMYAHSYDPVPDIREKNPNLPPGIDHIIKKTMAKDPEARYQSAGEFLTALEELEEKNKDYDYSKNGDSQESKGKKKNKSTVKEQIESEEKTGNQKENEKKQDKVEKEGKNKEVKKEPPQKDEKRAKPKRKFSRYFWMLIFPVIIIAAIIGGYFLIKSHGTGSEHRYRELMNSANQCIETGAYNQAKDYLNQALEVKNAPEAHWLLEGVDNKQREKMSRDFENLKKFLEGSASKKEKIEESQAFLTKHQNIPPNDQTKRMVSEINGRIDTLENESKVEEQNRVQIEKMKEDHEKLKEDLKGNASRDKKIEQCKAFLDAYKEIPVTEETKEMISGIQKSQAQYEAEIQADIDKGNKYQSYINAVKNYLNAGNYKKAADILKKAKQVNDTQEVKKLAGQIETKKREEAKKLEYERINGTREYNAIKGRMNLRTYLEFKTKYPGSVHLQDLQRRVKSADQVLPPETYWDKPIEKNDKGYYEYRFGPEHNGHLMIYIPGKNYWIDKYEVSNSQFRYSQKDEYPAEVVYEDAISYCREHGLNLPTEAEWEYAAGKGRFVYPWGNEMPNERGIYRANYDSFDGNIEKDGYEFIAPVKSFEEYASPFGIVNMAGNVEEWVQGKIYKGGGLFSKLEDLKIEKSIIGKSGTKKGFRCLKEEKED